MKKYLQNSLLFLGLFASFVLLHNFIYGIFKIEEPVFFTLSLIAFLLFLISLFVLIVKKALDVYFLSFSSDLSRKYDHGTVG